MIDKFTTYFFQKIQDNAFLRTKKGLLFVCFFIYYTFSCLLKPYTIQEYNNVLSIIAIFVYFIFWLYFSGRLFLSTKIRILFAIKHNSEAERYIEHIERAIRSEIDALNLTKAINIKKMPSDFIISDRKKAENYVKTKMIDLLIWGYTLEGKLQKSQITEFRLSFTYLYRILPEPVKAVFIKQIDSNLRGRYWRILDEKSFSDIQVVSTNIIEVSLFIIGLCLYVRGELIKSLELFEKLKILLNKKDEAAFPDMPIIKKQVDSYLVEGFRFIGERLREINPVESKKYFEKLLYINPNDSSAHLNIAKLCWVVDNDLKAARSHTDKVTDSNFKPFTYYNYAFFAIKENDPLNVLRYYQRIKSFPSENIVDIVAFLQNEFSKEPENILYHFALGYINIYHQDLDIGIDELKQFIEKAKGKQEYDELVKNAEPLLKNREIKVSSKYS